MQHLGRLIGNVVRHDLDAVLEDIVRACGEILGLKSREAGSLGEALAIVALLRVASDMVSMSIGQHDVLEATVLAISLVLLHLHASVKAQIVAALDHSSHGHVHV